jgi:hypothetical protein
MRNVSDIQEQTGVNPSGSGSTRREAVRQIGGGTLLAALATVMGGRAVFAQSATPVVDDSDPEVAVGQYAVVRTWTFKPDKSADELATLVSEGFVPFLRDTPGFRQYATIWNEETRQWSAISFFVDKAGADESTAKAQSWAAENVADYVESNPVVIGGDILVYAEAFPAANG